MFALNVVAIIDHFLCSGLSDHPVACCTTGKSMYCAYYWRISSHHRLPSFSLPLARNLQVKGFKWAPLGSQAGDRFTRKSLRMAPKVSPESGEASGSSGDPAQRSPNPLPRPPQPQPPPEGGEGNVGSQESQLEARLLRLIETLNGNQHNANLKNVAFEIGRPTLEPPAAMRRNPANPFGRFSIDELFKMKANVVSNNMATTEQMAKISSALSGLGIPTEQVANVILQMVIMCASVSSSAFLDPDGSLEFDGGAVPVDSVAAIMKRECGLRKVCRLYAPVVWNYMLVKNQPPSDWQALGFPKNARFAAFDTFDYVTNGAAIQPLEGLIREPTPEEVIAHNAHKRLALDRANRNERFANLETEYTGGLQGAEIVRNHRNANNA
nr:MAG: coat protein [Cactus carlavirus 1]